ncbi:NAD-dependent epimerase/dehydratase family protein [Paenibacillus sp. PL91]|uniref:NAD-dependent epimerase/dehydratase family protein n=1 Tax=Paenibacillus sp. PL91 TaxID=2729538 RepID=UPI00145F6829|nr:NAD-dependent epimerase/dehydratase family protein [Paenibacillus sp. PL91]MBC9204397.1 NAD-dependent epimerase/dehydratase family protein [Paenibacillus sp. PL91]
MRKILILGGTRFFGKKLVELLIEEQNDITIATRGKTADSFGHSVKRLQLDRTDTAALSEALGSNAFDVVYDNICYNPQEAEDAVKLFTGRTGKYIVTSSLSVYPFGEPCKVEGEFDPYRYPLPEVHATQVDYAEGKRLVEAVFFQKAAFPGAAVRFPIVLGHDDYTRRLHFHVEHILQGLPIGIPNLNAKMSFIHSDEAASFLAWLGHSNLVGPVNACSHGQLTIRELISLITQTTGKKANIVTESEEAHSSPFGVPDSWYMDTTKAEAAGFAFKQLSEWMPNLIKEIAIKL